MSKLSVIIPTHKERNIDTCISAIETSSYADVEIIIVDEGLERSKQRNIGIDRATGEYLLFLDSDMIISSLLIEECVRLIQKCNGVYLLEEIITPGLFGRIRNWERQFYTGTPIDCVRFVRAKDCPRFDETMSGPEDRDWDIRIPEPKLVTEKPYYHLEDVTFFSYFKKKAYYAKSMRKFALKNPNDLTLNWKWRCFGVFFEKGKWKKFLKNPLMACAVMGIIFIRGIIYLRNR